MDNRELFAELWKRLMIGIAMEARDSYIAKQKEKHEEMLEKSKQETGKYDRNLIEFALYKPNKELDDWLNELLIDFALEKGDRAAFKELTTPPLEGW